MSQRSHEENPEDEADDFMEMQLALHMMDRARLEATLYEDAFSKAMDKSATRSRRSGKLISATFPRYCLTTYFQYISTTTPHLPLPSVASATAWVR